VSTSLRIWRLGFESQPGPTPASTGWDNGCNYKLGNVHGATRPEQDGTEAAGPPSSKVTVAVAHRDLGVVGGLLQNRRRDYCGGCQAVQEDTFLWVGWLRRQESGQGGAAPYS
jgi:hypothetical protein